jgi:hypothetical protein
LLRFFPPPYSLPFFCIWFLEFVPCARVVNSCFLALDFGGGGEWGMRWRYASLLFEHRVWLGKMTVSCRIWILLRGALDLQRLMEVFLVNIFRDHWKQDECVAVSINSFANSNGYRYRLLVSNSFLLSLMNSLAETRKRYLHGESVVLSACFLRRRCASSWELLGTPPNEAMALAHLSAVHCWPTR